MAVLVGTRPEIIKMSPVIRELAKRRIPCDVIHTAQQTGDRMDRHIFRQLRLPAPAFRLPSPPSTMTTPAARIGFMTGAIERLLLGTRPGTLLVQGDTNSVLAGTIAGSRIPGLRIGHVEAGLRSRDRAMPEELNRIVADHLAHMLFAPTKAARDNLLHEGLAPSAIRVTGNTIVDAVRQNLELAERVVTRRPWRTRGRYFLLTMHRQEHVDEAPVLARILRGLDRVARTFQRPILFPVHPRTADRLRAHGLSWPPGLVPMEPSGFLEFLLMERDAELILTDSGGVQEEACILRVPCVTFRTTTERPETVSVGANIVCGPTVRGLLDGVEKMLGTARSWKNPFGDGRAAGRIVQAAASPRGRRLAR